MPEKTEDLIQSGQYDEGLDLNNLPAPPWTPENLGREVFDKLAIVSGAGHSGMKQIGLSLDPRTFGRSRAKRLIKLTNATEERAEALYAEGHKLQELIDEMLPPRAGTQRAAGAPPLRPSPTVKRTRTF